MLHYKDNQPYIEGVAVDDIIKTHVTPFYVYSQTAISKTYKELQNALNAEIFYAVKANSNQAIIKFIRSLGAGADVVSVGELKRALSAGVESQKIIFEGVGKSLEDILFAIEQNIRLINIESLEELHQINSIATSINKKVNVGIRLNPNIDSKTLDQISTGKETDKFGIAIDELSNIVTSIKQTNSLNLIGISCHIGSQIYNINVFEKIFKVMKNAAHKILQEGISIKYLDLGGGIGVQYMPTDPILNLEDLKNLISSNFSNVPYSISFEPGRYLVAKAGYLITKIVTTKKNGGVNYLITDAGMNTFIRPSLYKATHQITSINSSSKKNLEYTIAGPICESS
ncbi:uncharacterized protein METZ01_LOCUS217381, partial [marine metagenome]